MKQFVPSSFQPPTEAHVGEFVLRPLTEKYLKADVQAVNSSIDLIKATRGGSWPKQPISVQDDLADLIEHRQEFEKRSSFAYIILFKDQDLCAGSVYIYPPNHPFDNSDKSKMLNDADAVVSYWLSQQAFDLGYYPQLRSPILDWLQKEWPFKSVYISNKS